MERCARRKNILVKLKSRTLLRLARGLFIIANRMPPVRGPAPWNSPAPFTRGLGCSDRPGLSVRPILRPGETPVKRRRRTPPARRVSGPIRNGSAYRSPYPDMPRSIGPIARWWISIHRHWVLWKNSTDRMYFSKADSPAACAEFSLCAPCDRRHRQAPAHDG